MTKAEINEIRSKPYNQCTYDELLWALDELEKAQAVVERVEAERQVYRDMGEDDDVIVMLNFLDKLLAPLKPNYAQMVTDDEEALEDA